MGSVFVWFGVLVAFCSVFPKSDCEGFLLKISCGIRLLIIISSSSYQHHHQLIIISSFHHHHYLIIIIIISPSSSSFPSLSLAFLFFSILAQPSSHEKRARATPLRENAFFGPKSSKNWWFFAIIFFLEQPSAGIQKLLFFCDFGVPESVLRIVLTIRFATYGRFLKRAKLSKNRQKTSKTDGFLRFFHVRSNPLRESGCRVSKTEGFLRFWCARICPNNLFCYIRPSPRLSRGAPRWFQTTLGVLWMVATFCLLSRPPNLDPPPISKPHSKSNPAKCSLQRTLWGAPGL